MLNILCRRAAPCSLLELPSRLKQLALVQTYASFTLRDVVRESSDETGTLLTRFAKHIALERYKDEARELVPTSIRYADFFPITDERYFQRELAKTSADQLPALIVYAFSYRSNAQPVKLVTLLNELDAIATSKIQNMNMHTVLETLYSFLFLMPNWIMRLDFYTAAMKRLVEQDFEAGVAKETFVQICFYLGLNKKNNTTVTLIENFLGEHLKQYLPQLSDIDLAIVANAAYKTSTVIRGLPEYEKRLIDVVSQLTLTDGNDAFLVTFIKALRLQRTNSEAICLKLAELCQEHSQIKILEPRGLGHIFAYLVEQQWDNPECVTAITTEIFAKLRSSHIRAKDLATILWCCAQFNCQFTSAELQKLESLALGKLDNGEYRYFPDNLVDTCLSLWTLGFHSQDLLNAAVELKSTQVRRNARAQPKVDSRLTVLLSAAAIEQPDWYKSLNGNIDRAPVFNDNTSAPAYLLKDRSDLTTLAKQLSEQEDVSSAKLVCPIAGINVPSMLLKRSDGSQVFVELLTPNQMLHFSQTPVSLLRLKCRLMKALGHDVVVLNSNDAQDDFETLREQLLGRTVESLSTDSVQSAESVVEAINK